MLKRDAACFPGKSRVEHQSVRYIGAPSFDPKVHIASLHEGVTAQDLCTDGLLPLLLLLSSSPLSLSSTLSPDAVKLSFELCLII